MGTWRPHRPRGPIMALYSSPGPKYLIPPTTGKPLGLWEGGAGEAKARSGVGLGSSVTPRPSTPLGSMGVGGKGTVWFQAAQNPRPAGFVKHTPTKLRAPAYSFRGAPMLLAENCSPGPRYSVNPKILRTGKDLGPAYSILGRYHTKTTLTPGPGEGPWLSPSPAQASANLGA